MKLPSWMSFGKRSLENPATSLSDPDAWLFEALGARSSSAGISVSPTNSLEVTAVWAAVRRISSTMASLPLHVYARTEAGKEVARNHPVYQLLHTRPNPWMSSFVFRELVVAHLLIVGSSFIEVERNGAGIPIALWPIHPLNVDVKIQRDGSPLYVVTVDGQPIPLSPDTVIHIQGFSLDGCRGLVPVSVARNAIGLAKASEQYGATWFGEGGVPSGVLSHPGQLDEEGRANLRKSWSAIHSGKSRLAVLEEGMAYSPLAVAPEVSQFLESRQFSVSEIARVFLIPPHLIGDLSRSTFSNIEQQSIEYVQHCIQPWCARVEQELTHALLDGEYFAEFNLSGLMRGDSKSRAAYYATMVDRGIFSVNECRALENMNPVDGGDVLRVPLNMAPLPKDVPDEQ